MNNVEQVLSMWYTVVRKTNRYLTTIEHDSIVGDTVKNKIYWNSLGRTFSLYEFLKFHGIEDDEIDKLGIDTVPTFSLLNQQSTDFDLTKLYGEIDLTFDHFQQRGLMSQTVEFFKLEVSTNKNAVIIPVYNGKKRIGAVYRFIGKGVSQQSKYVTYINGERPKQWPEIGYTKQYKTVYLFEGYWSVMKWWQLFQLNNIKAVPYCLMNARVSPDKLYQYENNKLIYVADADDAGYNVTMKIKELFPSVKILRPDKMPDEMSDNEMLKLIGKG